MCVCVFLTYLKIRVKEEPTRTNLSKTPPKNGIQFEPTLKASYCLGLIPPTL